MSRSTSTPDVSGTPGHRRPASILLAAGVAAAVALLTLHDLDGTPPGLFIDEVAIALTARSLWETGADLDGNRLPLFPRVFRDKERPIPVNPVFAYAAIPFALAGPGGFQARLPAVLWFWIAAGGIGLCVHELTRSRALGFGVGAAAALTPWLFVIGRMGWEAISFPAITSFALWTLLRGTREREARWVIASGALFGLSLYAYSTARLLAPLTLAAAAVIWLPDARVRKAMAGAMVTAALTAIPLAIYMSRNPGALTWRVESAVWADASGAAEAAGRFAGNYIRYFSPRFLLFEGDLNPRHGTGNGMLPWIAAPLILAGLWEAWRRRGERPVQMVAAGLLIAPIAAALTTDGQPHATRTITAVIFWAALAGMGCRRLLDLLPRPRIAAALIALLAAVNAAAFAADYFGDFRARGFGAFDVGKGATLKEAFARRGNRPLYVPVPLLNDVRLEVFVPYWGELPVARWLEAGPSSLGIHPWAGHSLDAGLIVHNWYREKQDGTYPDVLRSGGPPAGARSVFSFEHDGVKLYDIFEK